VELFASVRPCSVTVSFNFRFLDEVSGKETAFPFVVLVLLLSPGDSSSGAGRLSEAIFELSACAELGLLIYYLSRDG
jgi:hypothetical protein